MEARPRMWIPIGSLQLAVRAAIAAALSLVVAESLSRDSPIFALMAAVLVTDRSRSETRRLGGLRMLATVVGAICGGLLTLVLPGDPWAVGVGILIAMGITLLMRAPEAAKVAGYTCGIIVYAHGAHPWPYAWYRFLETTIGIGVAWLVSFVPKAISIEGDGEPGGSPRATGDGP